MHYYIIGFKTGEYPVITRDRIFLWGRLSPAQANTPDPIGKPANYDIVSIFTIAPNSHRLNSLFNTDTRRCLGSRPAPDASAYQAHVWTLYRLHGIAEWTFEAKPPVDAVM